MKRYLSLVLAVALLFTQVTFSFAAETATATTMRLEKTEGTVKVTNQNGTALSARENSKLYNGNTITTQLTSYAYLALDDKKAVKLDESSSATVKKSGKKLELLVDAGQIFFNVSEPLKADETMEIRTSNMVTGIRGTSGVVNNIDPITTEFYLLDGSVIITYIDTISGKQSTVTVKAGEHAAFTKSFRTDGTTTATVVKKKLTEADIAGFAAVEISKDAQLQEKIKAQTDLNVGQVVDNAEDRLEQDQAEREKAQDTVNKEVERRDNPEGAAGGSSGGSSNGGGSGSSSGGGSNNTNPFPESHPKPSYTVTFEVNGGTPVAAQSVESGETAARPADPTRTGFTFGGWYTSAAFSTVFNFTTPVTASITLYAKWIPASTPNPEPNPQYSVTFVTNGGTAVAAQSVESGQTAVKPADPTRTGFTFGGWYTSADFAAAFDFATPITASITLYAKWVSASTPDPVPKPSYTVTFEVNGGTQVASQSIESGQMASKPADPIKTGFTFGGWYTSADFSTAFNFATPVTASITLYAKWTQNTVPKFTVTFEVNGGTAVAAQSVESGQPAVKPADPTKADFTFDGWYTSADFSTAFNFSTPVAASITLYAKWIPHFVTLSGADLTMENLKRLLADSLTTNLTLDIGTGAKFVISGLTGPLEIPAAKTLSVASGALEISVGSTVVNRGTITLSRGAAQGIFANYGRLENWGTIASSEVDVSIFSAMSVEESYAPPVLDSGAVDAMTFALPSRAASPMPLINNTGEFVMEGGLVNSGADIALNISAPTEPGAVSGFLMNDGVITSEAQQTVNIWGLDGNVAIEGGTIENTAPTDPGYPASALFLLNSLGVMNNGTILSNGAGVQIGNNASFQFADGTVQGSVVGITSQGICNMDGGTVRGATGIENKYHLYINGGRVEADTYGIYMNAMDAQTTIEGASTVITAVTTGIYYNYVGMDNRLTLTSGTIENTNTTGDGYALELYLDGLDPIAVNSLTYGTPVVRSKNFGRVARFVKASDTISPAPDAEGWYLLIIGA